MINILKYHVIANLNKIMMYKFATISSMVGEIFQIILLYYFWLNIFHADAFTLSYVIYSRVIYFFVGSNNVWDIAEDIKSGNIALKLVKPIGFLEYNVLLFLSSKIVGFFIQCIPILMVAILVVPIKTTVQQVLLCILSTLLSLIICYCFDFLISYLCIYTNSIWGISSLREGIIQILSGALIPIYLMPAIVQKVIAFFPFIYMVNTPVRILITNEKQLNDLLLQSIYCFLMIAAALFVDKRLNKRLQIQGG